MVVGFLKELLSFRSITPDDAGSLEFIAKFLPDFEAKFIEKNGKKLTFVLRGDLPVQVSNEQKLLRAYGN